MKIRVKIGDLVQAAADFSAQTLRFNETIGVSTLDIKVPTPTGDARVNGMIKKSCAGREIKFTNGHVLRCAERHILLGGDENEVFACDLPPDSTVLTAVGVLTVAANKALPQQEFYDIGIDAPHLYCDAAGIIHHNTLLTAALSSIIEPYGRSIIIVPSKSLVVQTEADYRNIGLDVGVFFGDRKEWGHQHTICTWQSLSVFSKRSRRAEDTPTIMDFIEGVTCVIVDEVHSVRGNDLRNLLCGPFGQIPIRWGLTGTIPKAEHEAVSLLAALGPIVGELRAAELQERGVLARCKIEILQMQDDHVGFADYDTEHTFLVTDKTRLNWLAQRVQSIADSGNTLVLVDRIETGETLHKLIPDSVFVSGATKQKTRQKEYDEVQTAGDKVIIATYGVAAVGINIPRLFNCVLIECGKSFVRTVQSIGRTLRKANDKSSATIYDISSSLKFSRRHQSKRKEYYKDAGYPFAVTKVDYR
jgi:hypothetical protein